MIVLVGVVTCVKAPSIRNLPSFILPIFSMFIGGFEMGFLFLFSVGYHGETVVTSKIDSLILSLHSSKS